MCLTDKCLSCILDVRDIQSTTWEWLSTRLLLIKHHCLNTLGPRKNGQHLANDIFNSIFVFETCINLIKISLRLVCKGLASNKPTVVLIIGVYMGDPAQVSQINSLTIVCTTVYSGTDQRKQQSCESLAFVRGIHRWPVNSLHKWPVTRKIFPFDDIIMRFFLHSTTH